MTINTKRQSLWTIFCESQCLATTVHHACRGLNLPVEVEVTRDVFTQATDADRGSVGIAIIRRPTAAELVALANKGMRSALPTPLLILGLRGEHDPLLGLANDIGLLAVRSPQILAASLAIGQLPAPIAQWPSTALLDPSTRARLCSDMEPSQSAQATTLRWVEAGPDAVSVAYPSSEEVCVGTPEAAAEAMRTALRSRLWTPKRVEDPSDSLARSMTDVLFGPARALSDPVSKGALALYGLPLPIEELCTSPSRAASEAVRIGFPVRMALASPDLRLAQHPELSVDEVDNAARVRSVYRGLCSHAESLSPDARVLGVVVGRSTQPSALLAVRLRPIRTADGARVHLRVAFADAHGVAACDAIETVASHQSDGLRAPLGRLRGFALLRSASTEEVPEALYQTLEKLAELTLHWQDVVHSVDIDPLVLSADGSLEVRDACIEVNDRFERELNVVTT